MGKTPWGMKWQPTPVLLPRKIPRTEEPGRLQSMGSQDIRHGSLSAEHTCRYLLSARYYIVCFKFPRFLTELNNLKFISGNRQILKYFLGAKYYMKIIVVVTMTLICDGVLGKLKVWMKCGQYKFSSLTLALIESKLCHSFFFFFSKWVHFSSVYISLKSFLTLTSEYDFPSFQSLCAGEVIYVFLHICQQYCWLSRWGEKSFLPYASMNPMCEICWSGVHWEENIWKGKVE